MPIKRFTTEAIIHKLREADVLSGQGKTIAEVCKQLGVTDKTYFRWRQWSSPGFVDTSTLLEEEFTMADQTVRYTPEFRWQMVALARSGRTAASLSKEVGTSAMTIGTWIKQAARDAGTGDGG